jgi:1,4-alpha-glucan branching enzyme
MYGVYAPVFCSNTAVAAFGRDLETSKSVWSSKVGYPGDPVYRDFYRDIGFDLDIDYLLPYIDPAGIPMSTGIKYYRITGRVKDKKPYDYQKALKRASMHAGDFVLNRIKQVRHLASLMDRPPIIVAPYDAELFGHWWYEGPQWLDYLVRKTALEQDTLALVTCSDYLASHPLNQVCTPSFSSWGENGYSTVWLDANNDWIYRHIQRMEERMTAMARRHPEARGERRRTLNQMARELLLAQSSDWAFILKTQTVVQYAARRIKEHIANFTRLYESLRDNSIDERFLALLESHNNIFPHIDYRLYL